MPRNLSFPEKLDRFPPVVIRILARVPVESGTGGVRVKTDHEIARDSGLTLSKVASLSCLTSWGEVPIDTIIAFCKGCGADLDNRDWQRHNAAYMKKLRSLPQYLRASPEWETKFKPLIELWVQSEAAA